MCVYVAKKTKVVNIKIKNEDEWIYNLDFSKNFGRLYRLHSRKQMRNYNWIPTKWKRKYHQLEYNKTI